MSILDICFLNLDLVIIALFTCLVIHGPWFPGIIFLLRVHAYLIMIWKLFSYKRRKQTKPAKTTHNHSQSPKTSHNKPQTPEANQKQPKIDKTTRNHIKMFTNVYHS